MHHVLGTFTGTCAWLVLSWCACLACSRGGLSQSSNVCSSLSLIWSPSRGRRHGLTFPTGYGGLMNNYTRLVVGAPHGLTYPYGVWKGLALQAQDMGA